jgi:integrase/recombinase XerD
LAPRPPVLRPLLREFAEYRLRVCGIAPSTASGEVLALREFLGFLRGRGRAPARVCLADVDAYVIALRERLSARTVQGVCCSIRAFLRFLHTSGRLRYDIAVSVMAPWKPRDAHPPRGLPWGNATMLIAVASYFSSPIPGSDGAV